MLKTVDRYVLREITVPFAVGLGLFFAVVAFGQVIKVSDSITGIGVTGGEVVQALLYSLPPLLGLLIPVSGLFATLLGVGRIAADREVVGMCAGGMSPFHLLRVPFAVGLVLATISGVAMAVGEPWGLAGLRDLMSRSAQRAIARGVRVGEFNEWVPGVMFLATGQRDGELHDVIFADRRHGKERPIVISARRGRVEQGEEAHDIVFNLHDGIILTRDTGAASDRVIHFEQSRYRLGVGSLVHRKTRGFTAMQEKDLTTLWWESRSERRSRDQRALATIVLNRKLAIPVATIIFALLAVPLACSRNAGARARGFLYSSAIVGAYYYIGRAAELSARAGTFNPMLAAWLPNLLGIVGLAILLVRFRRSAV